MRVPDRIHEDVRVSDTRLPRPTPRGLVVASFDFVKEWAFARFYPNESTRRSRYRVGYTPTIATGNTH